MSLNQLNKLTPRQASIRGAFVCAYPSSVTLVELFAPDKKYFDIISALISGRTYRAVAANYGISVNAIYTRESRFYRLAEKYLRSSSKTVRIHPHAYRVKTVKELTLRLPTGEPNRYTQSKKEY